MIRAYRMLAEKVAYPLHLGVTEAGTVFAGSIKSAVGIGTLLAEGIGDTIRVSLSADPVEEPKTAFEILKALGAARARAGDDRLPELRTRQRRRPHARRGGGDASRRSTRSVRGRRARAARSTARGRAGDADFGIAGGRDVGFIYAHGRVLKKVARDILDRRAVPRDRQVDRRRDAPSEAAQDGEAGRARDGRSLR